MRGGAGRNAITFLLATLGVCALASPTRAADAADPLAAAGSIEAPDVSGLSFTPLSSDPRPILLPTGDVSAIDLSPVEMDPILADSYGDDDSVYAPVSPIRDEESGNNGGAHLDLNFSYVNRYVYRGVNHDTVSTHSNALNLLAEGRLSFDLGDYPHPFVGVFANIYDADPLSRFQEIRPYAGFTWNLRPFLLEAGSINYIYPQRENLNVPEVYGKMTLDDALLLHTEKPILSPYIMAAYDYYHTTGWYLEGGVSHDFPIGETGLTLTAQADIAWISDLRQLFVFTNTVRDSGWQHAEFGLTGTYSLNTIFNLSHRLGEFDVKSYLFYDTRLQTDVTANDVFWGGVGIGFHY